MPITKSNSKFLSNRNSWILSYRTIWTDWDLGIPDLSQHFRTPACFGRSRTRCGFVWLVFLRWPKAEKRCIQQLLFGWWEVIKLVWWLDRFTNVHVCDPCHKRSSCGRTRRTSPQARGPGSPWTTLRVHTFAGRWECSNWRSRSTHSKQLRQLCPTSRSWQWCGPPCYNFLWPTAPFRPPPRGAQLQWDSARRWARLYDSCEGTLSWRTGRPLGHHIHLNLFQEGINQCWMAFKARRHNVVLTFVAIKTPPAQVHHARSTALVASAIEHL